MQLSEVQSPETAAPELGCRAVICVGGSICGQRSKHGHALHKIAADIAVQGEALLITTPSATQTSYDQQRLFEHTYGEIGGFRVTTLHPAERNIPRDEMRHKIENASIIFVPGGRTQSMLDKWERHDISMYLQKMFRTQTHTVFMGTSAGSIAPFTMGMSGSADDRGEKDKYGLVRALGLFPAVYSPHLDGRKAEFETLLECEPKGTVGIGIESHCALIRERGKCTIVGPQHIHEPVRVYENRGRYLDSFPLKKGEVPLTGLLGEALKLSPVNATQ